MATKEEMDKRDQEYADQFNTPDQPKREPSDDEAFGLAEPPAEAAADAPAADDSGDESAPEGSPAEEAAETPAEEAAEQAQGDDGGDPGDQSGDDAAPPGADQEQRLKSWEGRLKARQAELDAREAAMGNSGVNEHQDSLPLDGDDDGDGSGDTDGDGDGGGDPAQVLAEDFGQDFVDQITKLIKQIAGESVGGVSAQVDQVIAALQNDRMQNHFNQIASAHNDFMDVVDSPEFGQWKAAQPDQDKLQGIIDNGNARQIIDMLTSFKNATKKADNPDYDGDTQMDAAEGVRSSGLSLPKEPVADDDFARAWNEA